MTVEELLRQSVVYLGAAVVAVPVASRLGLGSVLGYLLAGVAIGPWALGLVAEETRDVMHFAELGVVMMLFLVGLELDPARIWRMRMPVFGWGGLQLAGTAALVAPVAALAGLPWQQALALGLIVAMSSTAIALQTLTEKGLLRTGAGQTSFAVLLFQDIAVIPLLALFPLLATLEVHHAVGEHHGSSLVDGLPGWQHALVVLGAVGAVIGAGRLGIGPLLRAVARTGLREMFTASALLIVLAVALLMNAVGLSAALGTFIAGVVLANSEFRHELMSDVEPFKGLLLGLFFIAVGASIDFAVLAESPGAVLGALIGVMLAKSLVLAGIARLSGLSAEQGALLALALPQVGEFAFVLFSFAGANGILPDSVTAPMVAVTAFSMAATPFLFTLHERVIGPRLTGGASVERESHVEDEHDPVIVAGFGRFGQITGRMLRSHGVGVTVLDIDSEQIDTLTRFGQKAWYGDASRLDLLRAAGAATAKVLVVAVDEHEKAAEIVHTAHVHFPHLAVLARARGRTEAYELVEKQATRVYRETFDTAVRVGVDVLRLLGTPAHAAHRAGRLFSEHDEAALMDLGTYREEEGYVDRIRERLREVERVLRADMAGAPHGPAHAWADERERRGGLDDGRATPPPAVSREP